MRTVIGSRLGSCTNTSDISRSFQTQRNWKIAKDASAGTESGSTTRKKMRKLEAPSTRAASIRSRGSVMKKFLNRKMQKGRAKAQCASQRPPNEPVMNVRSPKTFSPSDWKSLSIGTSDIWIGTTISATIARKIVSRKGKLIHEKAK